MVQSKDGINSIASCHSLSHHKFRWLQYHFFFALFPLLEVKKKKNFTRQNLVDAMSPEDGWFPLLLVDRDCVHTAGWIILPPQSRSWLDFLQSVVFFSFFFSSTVFVCLKKRKLPRTYIISQCARHARWWEQLFLTNTVHLQPPTQALDKWWSYPAKNRSIAALWIPNRLSFQPLRFMTWCVYSSCKKGVVYRGKSYPLTEGISEYTGGKMKHCCRCWCRQKTLRLCSWSSETAVILWKKKKKNCQLNFYFLSLCFFCTSLPVFSSAWGATDATSRKICFKAKWQYLF